LSRSDEEGRLARSPLLLIMQFGRDCHTPAVLVTEALLQRIMTSVQRDLPSGTVTLLFTDIEGSTKLLHELGAEAYAEALMEHRQVLREAFAHHGGVEVDTQGDAFFVVFPTAAGALEAAQEAHEALAHGPVRVRMGVHTGTPHLTEEGYVGQDVHKGARIAAAGHGGQVLLSKETRDLTPSLVTDLGEHRLKDFEGSVWIFQLGSERFPPLKTISNTNLPRPASSFVGRKREVEEVAALLRDGARLLTLTGPGGSGKTRLAIEAAAELLPEFKAGVFWVGLAPLRDPSLVTDTIARTLGARDGLAEQIGQRELLLLVDNLEQVIQAAPDIASLVEACPNLKVLVTSRELLRVRGEVEYPVLPLAEPDAVDLFCARSRTEADEAVHELCQALDNLPLALELAAARAGVLSPRQILDRLSRRLDLLKGGRDADPRQHTLRATIEWSYELLTPEEKRLFSRLAVFRGGCRLESAEEVAEASLDRMQSLVDKSLCRHRAERFWMLETIREYASERLEESGDAEEMHRRHAEHYLALAEEAEPHLRRDSIDWLDLLEDEHDNLRAALDWLETVGERELVLQLAGAISRFWYLKSHLTEGQRRLESALRTDDRPTPARASALNAAAVMALNLGSIETARLRAEEALNLHRALGDAWGVAYSTMMLGNAAAEANDLPNAQPVLEESVRLFRELGDYNYVLIASSNLAWVTGDLGDPDRERALHEENLSLARELGNERMEAGTLAQLAYMVCNDGQLEEAKAMLREAIRIEHRRGNLLELAVDFGRLAYVLALSGSARTAVSLLGSSESLMHQVGASVPFWAGDRNEKTLASIRTQLDEAVVAEAWEEGQKLTVDESVVLALDPVV
jgi:predicted ATPase/class 3 adenylate cyclase